MHNKQGLDESIKKDRQSKRWFYNRSYHRFFEGFSEFSVPKTGGKETSIERVYSGSYYCQDYPTSKRIQFRLVYLSLYLAIIYFFVSSAIVPTKINSTWYLVLPQAISLAFLSWTFISLINYIFAKKTMVISEYRRSSLSLKKATSFSAFFLGITAISSFGFTLFLMPEDRSISLVISLKFFVASLLTLIMYKMENQVKYSEIPSQIVLPGKSFKVD